MFEKYLETVGLQRYEVRAQERKERRLIFFIGRSTGGL